MKAAFWGLGIITIGLLGIVLINLFGNITVTNQLNYTTMKNDVEASMHDALDIAHYRSGFCLCTNRDKTNGKWVFNDNSEYDLIDITYDNNGKGTCVSPRKTCEILRGEYRIDKNVFTESLMRRFAEVINNNKNYEVIIQEVIEYPPKVSVRINSHDDEFAPTDDDKSGYTIVNQMDALIETKGGLPTPIPKPVIICDNKTYNGNDQVIARCTNGLFVENGEATIKKKNVGSYKVICENEDGEASNTCKINPTPVPTIVPPAPTSPPSRTTPKPTTRTTPQPTPNSGKIGGCFLEGTKVKVRDGYKNINELKAGDYVLTYNKEKNQNEYKKITYVFEYEDLSEELYTIKIDDTYMKLTAEHNVYIRRDGNNKYVAASELEIGDYVMYFDGKYHKIKNISHVPIEETVYNLEIEDNHNFYVGDKGILVYSANRLEITDETHGDARCEKSSCG